MGDEFFIIIDGTVDVIDEKIVRPGEIVKKKLVSLRQGHFVGE
jgi:uncharacterized cupin superfamily protein